MQLLHNFIYMGDESPSVMGSVQDVYEAGKAKAREALAALQSAMESLENGAEDVQEVLELYDDFSNLLECQKPLLALRDNWKILEHRIYLFLIECVNLNLFYTTSITE